ncbi:hypothetical protein [Photorhabdus cinerea]|uniref:hypothetical protein n=1 Tax=Photorhabdus cinerea TaxID=471575 RepID=UPI001F60650F|nr:hypothetical protein [Photorhabdus cinerea]
MMYLTSLYSKTIRKDEILTLVDKYDNPIGLAGKIDIHQRGMLHRAFSIFIFDYIRKFTPEKAASN